MIDRSYLPFQSAKRVPGYKDAKMDELIQTCISSLSDTSKVTYMSDLSLRKYYSSVKYTPGSYIHAFK